MSTSVQPAKSGMTDPKKRYVDDVLKDVCELLDPKKLFELHIFGDSYVLDDVTTKMTPPSSRICPSRKIFGLPRPSGPAIITVYFMDGVKAYIIHDTEGIRSETLEKIKKLFQDNNIKDLADIIL